MIIFSFLSLCILVPVVLCTPVSRPRRHVINENVGLWSPQRDACVDPVHTGPATGGTSVITDLEGYLSDLRETSMQLKDELVVAKEHIENGVNCQNIVTEMQNFDISDFLTIESAQSEYQNDVTRKYFEMRKTLYLFEILDSSRLESCCMHMSRFYNRLKNRLIGKWFILNSVHGQTIEDNHCCMSGTIEINRRMTCENIRDLSYTLLRHGITTIDNSIAFLQNWISEV